MSSTYDLKAPKRPANLTVNSDLLRQAKSFNINISSVLENALERQVREHKAEQWLLENKEAISIYNEFILENGVFSDGLRTF